MRRMVLALEIIHGMDQEIIKIMKNLKETQDIQKNYVDMERVHKESIVGDHVYLRVRIKKSSLKHKNYPKLEPKYCGPFDVLDQLGPIPYRIAFPFNMRSHNVFHVSLLKKDVHDPEHVIDWNVIKVEPKGEFEVEPLCILDRKVTFIWNHTIGQIKVQWKNLGLNEAR